MSLRDFFSATIVIFIFIFIISAQENIQLLNPDKHIEHTLEGGEKQVYKVNLTAGQFLHVVADQRGIDVVVTLYAPDGKNLVEVDSPNGTKGEESLSYISEIAGDYRLEISSLEKKATPGKYEVKIVELRNSTPKDVAKIKAKQVITEGDLLRSQKNAESYRNALEKFQESVKLYQEAGDVYGEGRALSSVGLIYEDLYQYESALEFQQKSLRIFQKTDDNASLALVSRFIAQLYEVMGEYGKAIDIYQQTLKYYEILGDKRQIHGVLSNMGIYYGFQGNHIEELKYHLKSLEVANETGRKGMIASSLINIGSVYDIQGNDALALENYQKALVLFQEVGAKTGTAVALQDIGHYYQKQNNLRTALEYYRKSNDTRGIGQIYFQQGDYKTALKYFQDALSQSPKDMIRNPGVVANLLIDISKIYAAKGDFAKAIENAEKACAMLKQSNHLSTLWRALTALGDYYKEDDQNQKAQAAFEEAIYIVENLRTMVVGGESEKQNFLENKTSPYKKIADLLISQGKLKDAITFAERTKSRTLVEVLQKGKTDYSKELTSQEREQEHRLKSELISFSNQISKENQSSEVNQKNLTELQNQLGKKRLEFEDFQIRLYAAHPELKIQRGEMQPISLEEAGKLLPDDKSALLEYVVTDNKAFLFALTKESKQLPVSLKVYPVDIKQKDLAQKTESFRVKLAKGDLDFAGESQDLYNLLLKPAEAQIKNKTNLIIVPDAALWDLPFQALQFEPNKYLIENTAISYAPSLTTLREMSRKNQHKQISGATLLAFGNPAVGKETSDKIKQVFIGENLQPLPEAERMVNSLQKMYGANRSEVFIGNKASEETAKTESAKFRIVQFATHGILNDANPMYSHLVLAQKPDDPNEDGLLEAWEMKDLDLKADLVILSGCDTARGKFGSGEGIIGMSWALFIAGTPTTVASQWKVESASATELMLEFHRQLLNGKNISKAEALRRAELKLLKMPKYKHPSYWAGFVMVGDGFRD